MSDLIKKKEEKKPHLIYLLVGLLLVAIVVYMLKGSVGLGRGNPTQKSDIETKSQVTTISDEEIIAKQRMLDEELKNNPPPLPCTAESRLTCVLDYTDSIFAGTGVDIKNVGVDIGGKTIRSQKAYYQLSFVEYESDKVYDAKGRVVASNSKDVYEGRDPMIKLGVSKEFYKSLSAKERRDLYLGQLVRAMFTLKGENSEDYVKLQAVTSKLDTWQPKLSQ